MMNAAYYNTKISIRKKKLQASILTEKPHTEKFLLVTRMYSEDKNMLPSMNFLLCEYW